MTPLVILSNRRSRYLPGAIDTTRNLSGWDELIVVDDSGDDDWRASIDADQVIAPAPAPAGYTAAMRTIWTGMAGRRFFFLEEDFRLTRPADIAWLHPILDSAPQLAQIALQRPPWYRIEKKLGLLGAQRQRIDIARRAAGQPPTTWASHAGWIEHDAGFTGNPSLISAAATAVPWPDTPWSEDAAGDAMRAAGLRFGYYGQDGEVFVEHVGHERAEHSAGY